MTRPLGPRADPFEHEIELAFRPGVFIPDRACSSFVSDLEAVAAEVAKLIRSDPTRATALEEAFLACCYEKAEELDDSSGSFGQFVAGLCCGWIRARQAAGADPDETATRLLARMDDDPYGFCSHLERDAAEAFDKAGLAAFVKQIRARFDAAATAVIETDASFGDPTAALRRHWGEVLRRLYLQQKNLAAYLSLAEATGVTAQDCHDVATLLASRRKPAEALNWVARGMDLGKRLRHGSPASYSLVRLERELLAKLGRGGEALAAAWTDYRKHPSLDTYEDLMEYVPDAERSIWHAKAMDATTGTDLDAAIDLLLDTKELERLVEVVRQSTEAALEDLSHYTSEPAARELEKSHPDVAARLWRAQGMRIIGARKSKYYDAALSNFEHAMRCYKRAGHTAEWEQTVTQVRAAHHRKIGFMAGFEALVAGSGPSARPSFLERAKSRWGRQGSP